MVAQGGQIFCVDSVGLDDIVRAPGKETGRMPALRRASKLGPPSTVLLIYFTKGLLAGLFRPLW